MDGGAFNYMKREILFRGKGVNDGRWYHGSYLRMDKTTYCFAEDYEGVNNIEHFIVFDQMTDWGLPNNHIMVEVDPETVGQYTGLTDKNRAHIFEGDIITARYVNDGRLTKGVVNFLNGCFCVKYDDYNNPAIDMLYEYEIIGNIHDNPELLEG